MITRRDACLGLATGLLLAPAAADETRMAKIVEFAKNLPSRDSARAIGAAYLASHPGDNDPQVLARALMADLGTADALRSGPLDQQAIARGIAEAVRADFIEGRLVRLEGWVFSRTEARFCGLCSLL
jgi:hypothetical protein